MPAQKNPAPYDLIIVGGGTAGCILAARIAEHGLHPRTGEPLRIALLEAGPYFKGAGRPGYGIPLRRRLFTNIPHEFVGNPRYAMTGGSKLLGGSSVTFGGQSHLPFPEDYSNWEYATGVDWTQDNFRAAAEETRRVFNVHSDPEAFLSDGQRRFRAAARSLGFIPHPYEGAKMNCLQCGYCFSGNLCKYDAKMSTLITHIPAAERHGVEIIPDAMAEKVLFRGKRATGVVFRQSGRETRIQGECVLLSCGAVQTPLLLWRSGYGPGDLLGARTRIESPAVGRRAHCHPENYVWALFPDPIKDGDRGWNAGSYFLHHMNRYGHDSLFLQDSGMGGCSTPEAAALSPFAPEFGKAHKRFVNRSRRALGRIVLWTTPKDAEGLLNDQGKLIWDRSHPIVLRRLSEGIDLAIEILQKMGAERWIPKKDLLQNIRTPHLTSTCRAGTDPRTSAVDAHFTSHEVDNLLVCDASVLPRCSIGSLAMSVATVATFAARRIVERHFNRS